MPFFDPPLDPGSNFPELLRKMGFGDGQPTHAGDREFVNGNFFAPSGFRTGTDIDHTGFLVRGGVNWRFWGM